MADRQANQLIQQAMGQPQQTQMQIAAPMNDTQLVVLTAAQLVGPSMDPKEAVEMAIEVVAEAVVQVGPQQVALRRLIQTKIEALRPQ